MDNDFFDIAWDAKAGEDLDRIYEYLSENASENVAKKGEKGDSYGCSSFANPARKFSS